MSVAKAMLADKTRKKRKKSGGKAQWMGFLEVNLTAEHKRELKETDLDVEYPLDGLEDLVQDGYKVGFGMDKDGVTFRCVLTDVDTGSPTAGYALSGRGKSLHKALASVMYKHTVLLPDGWGTANVPREAEDFD